MHNINQNVPTKKVVIADKYNNSVAKANAIAKQPMNVGTEVKCVTTPFFSRKPIRTCGIRLTVKTTLTTVIRMSCQGMMMRDSWGIKTV